MTNPNSFNTRETLDVNGDKYEIYNISKIAGTNNLPFSIKILLENLLRNEDGKTVTKEDIQALLDWDPAAKPDTEIAYRPARVLMQDFTGVPAVVDLAAMRDAVKQLGGSPDKINPLQPAELVIDHSIQIDAFGSDQAIITNSNMEFKRNEERYKFLKWGQQAFDNFKVVPPDMGIVHQINLEYLARVVFTQQNNGITQAYPDTLVGTDSHTTMVNGVGVLGWGVGGIEAEASMLGQPVSMLIPQVVGFKLSGCLPEGATATDLVLRVVEMLRELGVVGKFVEFYGDALALMPMGDRATLANMAPEYGATCGLFPIDDETLRYLDLTNRSAKSRTLVETYAKAVSMWNDPATQAKYSETIELDLGTIKPAIAGPKRPQDRINLDVAGTTFTKDLATLKTERNYQSQSPVTTDINGAPVSIADGSVVIASITSCTNTSNPSVMIAAGLLARNAKEKGIQVKPWVKTSLAPGSKVVTKYLKNADLMDDLEALGFYLVGYGCATCIGNSGPLIPEVSKAISDGDLTVTSVLSGNRNFEGRVHPEVRMNYLASPPLVVAYAITGTMDINLVNDVIATTDNGDDVYLKDIWPTQAEIQQVIDKNLNRKEFETAYSHIYEGDAHWQALQTGSGQLFEWPDSTYIAHPPYFQGMGKTPEPVGDINSARLLAKLGDSVTTDHISPAGSFTKDSPAGKYLIECGVNPTDFNSYGSRRGNHEVMMRGTFANIRLQNLLVPGTEGSVTEYLPTGEKMSIFDAAMKYKADNTPVIIIAGKEYGTGSSRDWAAKGPSLLGVKAVIAASYERIHRSNLVGMGILPLQFKDGESADTHGLTGREIFSITDFDAGASKTATITVANEDGTEKQFEAIVRIDTPQEIDYYRHGGILHYVLRQLAE